MEKKIMGERLREVYEEIEKLLEKKSGDEGPLLVGIDGRCGAGKSTLGGELAEWFGGTLFHMDDFFLRPEQRTEEWLKEPGGNVDRERFKEEVLERIKAGEEVHYRRYDCRRGELMPEEVILPGKLVIVEGAYCFHPYFGRVYDLKIFLDISHERQVEVIRRRNGAQQLARFLSEWIPMEEQYFEAFKVPEGCDIVLGDGREIK